MTEVLSKEICDLLETAFHDKIENFTIDVHEGKQKGEGYLGELIFISLKGKNTRDNHLVIKQATSATYPEEFVTSAYANEINFYTKIWPRMDEFQKLHQEDHEIVDNIATCYYTVTTKGSEKVVLENLKFKNYQLHPESVPLDFKHYEQIFKLYGKYHAISFAMKKLDSATFLDASSLLHNNWAKFFNMFPGPVGSVCAKIKNNFDPKTEKNILDNFLKYHENGVDIVLESVKYDGSHPVIVHGDCRSNNVMFKCNASKELEDIKIIDFQMSFLGSPVHDLSYSLYSGAGKETLKKLDDLLKIYHKSLSVNLQKYGCVPEQTYPFTTLKKEWKNYCRFGFVVGLLVLSSKENSVERMKTLVRHMNENKLL